MKLREGELFTPTQPEIALGLIKADTLPEGICYTTASVLELLTFFPNGSSREGVRYLATTTRGFLRRVMRGFYGYFDKGRVPSQEFLAHFLQNASPELEELDSRDCYDFWHAGTIFQLMPLVYGNVEGLHRHLSSKHHFMPPKTTAEYFERITELQGELNKIAFGITPPKALLSDRSETARAFVFFWTSKFAQQTVATGEMNH